MSCLSYETTFKKNCTNIRTVKDINLDQEIFLEIHTVYAKCLNPNCKVKTFPLPLPIDDIEKYQKATNRLKAEAVASNILDNNPVSKVKNRFSRSLNVTASRPTIDRWKHTEADKYSIKDILFKLNPSGIRCLDDVAPLRSNKPHLMLSDKLGDKNRILYIAPILS